MQSLKEQIRPRCRIAPLACCLTILLAACSTMRPPAVTSADTPSRPAARAAAPALPGAAPGPVASVPVLPPAGSGRGGYYLDDGPGDTPPPDLQSVPDAIPKIEPYSSRGNKPYVVFGKTYVPVTDNQPLKQRGRGSWYGKKFHGQKTSSGELYDMYKMTAAHPTLPIPSYARVTNMKNGAQVVVRVNDRGPFHSSRIIDLSYTAALKLGYIGHGSADLEVERLLPDEIARMNSGNGAAAPPQTARLEPAPETGGAATPVNSPAAAPSLVPAIATASSLDEFLGIQKAAPAIAAGAATMAEGEAAVSGFYLQFGAYAQGGNAEIARRQLMRQWPAVLPGLEVRQSGMLYRLYSGPFGTRGDAVQAATLLSAGPPDSPSPSALPKPVIVRR